MLPIYDIEAQVLELPKGSALVITAPTGSGKSTQTPQMLLKRLSPSKRILVLQPRRLAARMLAERVAAELGEKVGATVGFQTRFERVFSNETRILFITEGILARMLIADMELPDVEYIIFDEFHERSLNTDVGLAMAQFSHREFRPDLSLIVMSATIDAAPVSRFLDDCPCVSSSGRMFDVAISYCPIQLKLEGAPMAAAKTLASQIRKGIEGDFLVFMPGGYEIRQTLEACRRVALPEDVVFMPLYGNLPPEEQRKVMRPADRRKVIVATNIAETSLTIPGVRNVIDSGLVRMNRYSNARGIDVLETMPIARDSAEQRAGRAGREAPGTCVRLWTELEQGAKPARTIPEIQRADLADTVLSVIAFGFNDPLAFPWFERPNEITVRRSVELLEKLGFILPNHGGLTQIGRKLQAFPAHPRLALLVYLGAQNGCLEQTAMAAALLSERPLMLAGATPRRMSRHSAVSDFFPLFDALYAAKAAKFNADFCENAGINAAAARDILRTADDFKSLARRFETNESKDADVDFVKCILRAFPDRIARRPSMANRLCELPNGKHAELAKDSLADSSEFLVAADIREASSIVKGALSKFTLSCVSAVSEEWLLEFFPDAWREVDAAVWNEQAQRVVRKQAVFCLDLLVEEKIRQDPDPEKAAEILAAKVMEGKINLSSDALNLWLDRVAWTRSVFPEMKLPDFEGDGKVEAMKNLCFGEVSVKALKDKDVMAAYRQCMTKQQLQFVEKMAPPFLYMPTGHKLKIEYKAGQTPKGRARIQDFYDVKHTPTVAGGKVRLLLDILAPNNRTVQITDDLDNFWRDLYPKIKPELSRRYPRHPWK